MSVEREQELSSELALLIGCCKDASTVAIHANERSLNTASASDQTWRKVAPAVLKERRRDARRTVLHSPSSMPCDLCEAASACKKEGLELASLGDANFLTATTTVFHEAGANTPSPVYNNRIYS